MGWLFLGFPWFPNTSLAYSKIMGKTQITSITTHNLLWTKSCEWNRSRSRKVVRFSQGPSCRGVISGGDGGGSHSYKWGHGNWVAARHGCAGCVLEHSNSSHQGREKQHPENIQLQTENACGSWICVHVPFLVDILEIIPKKVFLLKVFFCVGFPVSLPVLAGLGERDRKC